MKITVLASGSKGNSTLIKTEKINVLIDCGVTYQYLCSELDKVGITPKDLNAILITHTHSDHIKGLQTLVSKTNLDVYILNEMYKDIKAKVPDRNIKFYENPTQIEDLNIELIRISHDVEGVGFVLESNKRTAVYITDTGYINKDYFKKLKNKNLYIIESNHDEKMLMEGPYPYILKQRVISDKGHLSNKYTGRYLNKTIGDKTKYIVLAHLSENNNTPELALEQVKEEIKDKYNNKIIIAKQHEETEMVEI